MTIIALQCLADDTLILRLFKRSPAMSSQGDKYTCFCVFRHDPFEKGKQGGEDGSRILEKLVYKYPDTVTDRQTENLLSVIISLYTFSTLSLNNKKLDFMSWSNSKVAIKTFQCKDTSQLFFVLRTPAAYSDSSVSRALDHIKRGLFFVLGQDGLSDPETVQKYLETEGERICLASLPPASPDPLPFSFTNIPNAEWNRTGVTTVLTEALIMHQFPTVWGIICFVNERMLVSYSPLEVIRLFDFVAPSEKRHNVFLTAEDRKLLTGYKGCVAKIPELDVIPATLLKFAYETVEFYLLVDPTLSDDSHSQIHEMLTKAMPEIATHREHNEVVPPQNTIWYDRVLHILRAGTSSSQFKENAIYAHDSFVRDGKLRDMIMFNAKEFSVCMNILTVEHFTSVNGFTKNATPAEMYDEALRADPSFLRFLQSLHIPQGTAQ